MAELIRREDDLNTGREKLNNAIVNADEAKQKSNQAVNVSEQAKQIAQTAENKADNVQEQFNQVVIEGDSSVEAAQARVDAEGKSFPTLKARLDEKETQFSSQLAHIAANATAYTNNTVALQNLLDNTNGKVIGGGLTYYLTQNLTISNDIELEGFNFIADYTPDENGQGVIDILGDNVIIKNTIIDGVDNNHTGITISGSNVFVEHLHIKNCKWAGILTFNACEDIRLSHIEFDNCTGVFLGGVVQIQENAKNVLVEFCRVDKAFGKGFVAIDCEDVTFRNCIATDCEFENFSPRRNAYRIKFEKCISKKNEVGIETSGVKCSRGAIGVVFDQCLFEQYGGEEVVSPFQNQGCSDIIVKDSVIRGNTSQLILLSWHPGDGTNYPPTPANNNSFINNVIESTSNSHGIRIDPSFSFDKLESITIKNNIIKNVSSGVLTYNVKNLIIEGNKFENVGSGCVIVGKSNNPHSENTVIRDNVFDRVKERAIRTYHTKNIFIDSNTLNGETDIQLILLDYNTTNGKLSNNIFILPFNTGVNIHEASSGIIITGNSFKGDGLKTGIRQNGTDVIISNNHFDVSVPLNPIGGGIGAVVSNNIGVE